MILKSTAQCMAYRVGRQVALRSTSEAMDQLTAQLVQARADLQQARAEHEARMAEAKKQLADEAFCMRQELTAAIAELHQLRAHMFSKWERHQGDRLQ